MTPDYLNQLKAAHDRAHKRAQIALRALKNFPEGSGARDMAQASYNEAVRDCDALFAEAVCDSDNIFSSANDGREENS